MRRYLLLKPIFNQWCTDSALGLEEIFTLRARARLTKFSRLGLVFGIRLEESGALSLPLFLRIFINSSFMKWAKLIQDITFEITFVEILLWNPLKMEKFNHKKKFHSNLGVFKDKIAYLFQIQFILDSKTRARTRAKAWRNFQTRTPYRVQATRFLCITVFNQLAHYTKYQVFFINESLEKSKVFNLMDQKHRYL